MSADRSAPLNISVFGLGYVGAVSCACLPQLGHTVVGVDTHPRKVELIHAGQSPVVEEQIDELMAQAVAQGRLRATTSAREAVMATEVSLISVATPAHANYTPDLRAVEAVITEIGSLLRDKPGHHTVVLRSTVPPGTTDTRIRPLLEAAAGRPVGDRLSLVFNPEFLREGSSVKDFHEPPQTVVGSFDTEGYEVMERLYRGIPGAFVRTGVAEAEAVKYLCNVFHALKIVFANEAGAVLKAFGLDSREVLRIFCQDRQLNISPAYMRPGFAFGGSCLPKEVKGFMTLAKSKDVRTPAMGSLIDSNELHIARAYDLITQGGRCTVAFFGLAFKPGTDDLRDSPFVTLIEKLVGRGYGVQIHDPYVQVSRLMGKNKDYVDREIPHLDKLLREPAEAALHGADCIVVGHADAATRATLIAHAQGRRIIDLNGYRDLETACAGHYEGLCW